MKKLLDFISKTSSGMAIGLFATLIIGTVFKQLFSFGDGFEIGINIANTLMGLMGPGIAIGVTLSMNKDISPLKLIACMALGGLISSINLLSPSNPTPTFILNGGSKNPLLIYLTIIITNLLTDKILTKKTPVDILLIPSIYVIIGSLIGFGLIYPCYYLIYGIQTIIETAMPMAPILMSIIIAVIMGMVLTMPISSVAVCVAIQIGNTPLAAGAALIGCTAQMVGFAVQALKAKNGVAKAISVGIGTSMLYWPNIIKKPAIWLPTISASIILGPIGVCLLNTSSTSSGAGMGSCGLVGQLSTLESMGYDNYMAYISVFIVQILGSIVLTLLFDYLYCNILHLYDNNDLKLQLEEK